MTGQSAAVVLPDLLPLSGVLITVDALGGVFLAITGGVAVAVGIYGIGYCRQHGLDSRLVQTALPLFVTAMMLVPVAGECGHVPAVLGTDGADLAAAGASPSTAAGRRWRRPAAGMR